MKDILIFHTRHMFKGFNKKSTVKLSSARQRRTLEGIAQQWMSISIAREHYDTIINTLMMIHHRNQQQVDMWHSRIRENLKWRSHYHHHDSLVISIDTINIPHTYVKTWMRNHFRCFYRNYATCVFRLLQR